MPYFRVLCWRLKIAYKRTNRSEAIKSVIESVQSPNFKSMTLVEIKEATQYRGSINSLQNVLLRNGIDFKRKKKGSHELKGKVLANIQQVGDTTKLQPQQILDKLGIQVVNPSAFLRRLSIPYKARSK